MPIKSLSDIRREYGQSSLSEENLSTSPFTQFETWFSEVLTTETTDPTAMVLSTVDEQGHPDSRIVLLKELKDEAFVFYTNYESTKAKQIEANPYAALNFYWPQLARQVRVRGTLQKISEERSDAYFSSRPRNSQLSAIISRQSHEINNREELLLALEALQQTHQQNPIVRPAHWGGYEVIAEEIEFWQGRDDRLHDRVLYKRKDGRWIYQRLAP